MKNPVLRILGFALLAVAPLAHAAGDADGNWLFSLVNFGEEYAPARVTLRLTGDKLDGNLNELKLEGHATGRRMTFTAVRPDGREYGTFTGSFAKGEWRGQMSRGPDSVDWVMRRLAEAGPAQVRVVSPTRFSRTFSALVPPLLRINPGDTVRTKTIDSSGHDETGKRVSFGGNPQTGPFFIDGALPGDTLAVTLNRIRPNRARARSGTVLVPSVVTADYHRNASYDGSVDGEWILDLDKQVARLATPPDRLKNYEVPLHPFLGGIGVAPDNKQAIDARALGRWGGNLDYAGLQEGTTLYLPVFEVGALLFVGDGHAAQGDGELAGDALETSMDVEFTVQVLAGKTLSGPRAENDRYLMAMGIAGSAADATREATAALAGWLAEDYGLSAHEAALVLGSAGEFDIAELVDPQINVVAKISKATLSKLAVLTKPPR
jgi:amidase